MPKPSNRDRILAAGLRVVHERGFAGASVRDIVQAAGVPQGSFSNHFASKEAFGLEVIELHLAAARALMRDTLCNDALPPLQRLGAYLGGGRDGPAPDDMRNGCLFGNFTAEANAQGEAIRRRLVEVFAEMQHAVARCLGAAVAAGELPAGLDCDDMAGFIVSSLQGATLLAKVRCSPEPLQRFRRILFSTMLRQERGGGAASD